MGKAVVGATVMVFGGIGLLDTGGNVAMLGAGVGETSGVSSSKPSSSYSDELEFALLISLTYSATATSSHGTSSSRMITT